MLLNNSRLLLVSCYKTKYSSTTCVCCSAQQRTTRGGSIDTSASPVEFSDLNMHFQNVRLMLGRSNTRKCFRTPERPTSINPCSSDHHSTKSKHSDAMCVSWEEGRRAMRTWTNERTSSERTGTRGRREGGREEESDAARAYRGGEELLSSDEDGRSF